MSREMSEKLCVALTLALCAIAAVSGVRAEEDPPPAVEPCIEVTVDCVDAPPFGAPIPIHGVVTNCSDQLVERIMVSDGNTGAVYLDYVFVDPGQSVEWWGEYLPEPFECPARVKIRANAYTLDWSQRADDRAETECGCTEFGEICRTAGFWGLHAGTEKNNSQNVTQAVIDAAPAGLMVCGEMVDNTDLDRFGSALEATCLSVQGAQVLQLARQLTAAALNCVISGSPMDCDGTSIAGLFSDCNAACATGTDPDEIAYCETAIDCWNNGGDLLPSGMCQLGVCAHDGSPCEENENCGYDLEGTEIECVPFTDTCHDQPLVNEDLGLDFEPPGAAGSSRACNAAIRNDCTFFENCGD